MKSSSNEIGVGVIGLGMERNMLGINYDSVPQQLRCLLRFDILCPLGGPRCESGRLHTQSAEDSYVEHSVAA